MIGVEIDLESNQWKTTEYGLASYYNKSQYTEVHEAIIMTISRSLSCSINTHEDFKFGFQLNLNCTQQNSKIILRKYFLKISYFNNFFLKIEKGWNILKKYFLLFLFWDKKFLKREIFKNFFLKIIFEFCCATIH